MTHQYSRAERLLIRPFSASPSPQPGAADATDQPVIPSSAMGNLPVDQKGKGRETDTQPGTTPRLPMGPAGLINLPEELQAKVSRLVDMSVACRYLAAQCQVRQGNWSDALEMLGEANPFRHSDRSGAAVPNIDGGIKVEASMCHLRGILMLKLNRGDQAKLCFMEALTLDVKCYDAFNQLIGGEMMTPDEEWEFIQGLAYKQQTNEDADFVQLMYTSRLRKCKHIEEHALTRQRLVEDYKLSDNPDVLYSFADALYTQFRWADCFVITTRILELVAFHDATLPLHIACMYHLSHLQSKLFVLAHELVDREPENPISWYAVGVWYFGAKKWSQARQYFSKTSLMDPRFGPAWIAFAHTFAREGEHDHAVTAYSTCARMFAGSHLPLLFIGMEQMMLSNHQLAEEALHAAHAACDSDPLLINELGVMAFTRGEYQEAANLFERSLVLARVTQSSEKSWTTTYLNLGTSYRKLKDYEKAKYNYQRVLEIEPQHPQGLGFLGMVYHFQDQVDKAIVKYHEALSVDPINGHLVELLNLALESNIACGSWEKVYPGGEEAFRGMMASLKSKITKRAAEARPGDGNHVEEPMNVALGCPDWDLLDSILSMLLASPSLPEKTLDVCQHTCSQLVSGDGQWSSTVNPQTVHRLFSVLVNIANLMHRIDSTMPATTECYMRAVEVVIQSPQSHCSASRLTFQDFVLAAWTIGLALTFVRESRVPPHIAHALKSGGHANILTRVGNSHFDVMQAVHDAGDDLMQALVDPATGTLPALTLFPEQIIQLSAFLFAPRKGVLPGILMNHPAHPPNEHTTLNVKVATASVLLSLARRYQSADGAALFSDQKQSYLNSDGIVLLLHYVAASLYPNASIFNDIGVILCGLGPGESATGPQGQKMSGRDIARLYYERGLQADPTHPHLLSNLGSLLKDAGHTVHAIGIFNHALTVHPDLDIALVNMANTLKDAGQCAEAVPYYLKAISVNPDISDAYCGLSHSMNAVSDVWMQKAIEICEKQLSDANSQAAGLLRSKSLDEWLELVRFACGRSLSPVEEKGWVRRFQLFLVDDSSKVSGAYDEGSFFIRTMEWCLARLQHAWYIKEYGNSARSDTPRHSLSNVNRPTLPNSGLLSSMKYPRLPYILPFHTFTLPLSSRMIRLIAHRNALNAFFAATTYTGRTAIVHPPPPPPLHGRLNIGYMSSDFNRQSRWIYQRGEKRNFRCTTLSSTNIADGIRGHVGGWYAIPFYCFPFSCLSVDLGWCDYLVCDPIACPPDTFAVVSGRSKCTTSKQGNNSCDDVGVPVSEGCDPASPSTNWIYTECPIYMPVGVLAFLYGVVLKMANTRN
ncbi:hypothetical protein ID866_8412 [Astraeus odoratus]|nr:hypothetical protein ID866_8412 [Astraeus odoratus]